MKHNFKYAFLFFVAFLFVLQNEVGAQDLEIKNILVEQQSHPIGIATATPRFSWQISSGKRAVKQVAYEILVATSKANLEKNVGDVWSSGKVSSDNALLIPYKGTALKSNRYYYVKIKAVTNRGEEAWSKPMFLHWVL
ncbi:glycoside hydrolase family 78 protein [Niabella hibiscisoli]|uniref:glycoside hydrolase family 78 protein n=1 Tax=Niabella hibiscisoli TaxID=1825928 RepID=UPI001F116CE3|nr:hypothetical protein [Niabella hibiscisoli]MCH5720212.1 hypothetical protein [Niabella hibiscisoli]